MPTAAELLGEGGDIHLAIDAQAHRDIAGGVRGMVRCRREAGMRGLVFWMSTFRFAACIVFATTCSAVAQSTTAPTTRPAWAGPDADFRDVDGTIVGPWWQGGGPAVVYFTGPFAHRHQSFIHVGQALADKAKRPYLEIGKDDLRPSDADDNGVLLYPDGTARVRLLMMPGGNAFRTMCEVSGVSKPTAEAGKAERGKFKDGRVGPQAAFNTGMNYVGVCAGFFAASSGYDIPKTLYADWGLWPGKVKNIGPTLEQPLPDVVFDPAQADHPLYKATNGGTLKNMYFNGGPVGPVADVPDTEYFGHYRGGAMPQLHGDRFLIAYRPRANALSGRCVISTGHPEVNHPDFLMAMAAYAMDHEYEVPRRPIKPGEPVKAVIGDEQMQYYTVSAAAGQKLRVTLSSLSENCDLYLRPALPPTFRHHAAAATATGRADEELSLRATEPTTYFIGIYGHHAVLNGASYTLQVTLD